MRRQKTIVNADENEPVKEQVKEPVKEQMNEQVKKSAKEPSKTSGDKSLQERVKKMILSSECVVPTLIEVPAGPVSTYIFAEADVGALAAAWLVFKEERPLSPPESFVDIVTDAVGSVRGVKMVSRMKLA